MTSALKIFFSIELKMGNSRSLLLAAPFAVLREKFTFSVLNLYYNCLN